MSTVLDHGGTSWNQTGHFFHINVSDSLAVRKAAIRLACSSFWVGLLLTVLLTFLILSTPKQRNGVVFFIQCVSFSLALVYNITELAVYFSRIRLQFDHSSTPIKWQEWNNAHMADISFEHIVPIIADSAIIFKISSFFPVPVYSITQRALVIAPLIVILVPRLVFTALGTYYTRKIEFDVKWLPSSPFPLTLGFPWSTRARRCFQADFGLGALYALYASAVLLKKAAEFATTTMQHDRNRLRLRLRFFAEAVLMTFIPPFLFSVTAAGVLDCPPDKYCYYREMAGTLINVSVLFSLLATSWSSIRASYDKVNGRVDDSGNFIPYDGEESSQEQSQARAVVAFFRDGSRNSPFKGCTQGSQSTGTHSFNQGPLAAILDGIKSGEHSAGKHTTDDITCGSYTATGNLVH